MPTAIQTPLNAGPATKVGRRLFRKQVLPVGEVEHEGRTLQFTRPYLDKLAANFSAGTMDQVPFTLVDGENKHTDDPERVRGEVTGVEVADDGLYALIQLSEKGAETVGDNPKLGASCRIAEDGTVLKHVAGTLDPVVKGMRPWETIELSDGATAVIDLTDAALVKPSGGADTPSGVSTDALSDTEVAALREIIAKNGKTPESDLTPEEEREVEEAVAKLVEEEEPDKTPAAALSEKDRKALDLAQSQAKDAADRAARLESDLAAERFKSRKRELVSAGVPPVMVDLAKPILLGQPGVIELSNGVKADAHDIVSKLLDEVKGTIDFSERGSGSDDADDAEHKATAEAYAKRFDKDKAKA